MGHRTGQRKTFIYSETMRHFAFEMAALLPEGGHVALWPTNNHVV
jgi:hypothetical protein